MTTDHTVSITRLRRSLRKSREHHRLQSYAYGLLYDVINWTSRPVTEAMEDVFMDCMRSIRLPSFDQDGFDLIGKRLVAAGFSTFPEIEDE